MKITKRQLKKLIKEALDDASEGLLVKYPGIVKLQIPDEAIEQVKSMELPANAVVLPDKSLHITLLHQSAFKDEFLKPKRKEIKKTGLPNYTGPLNLNSYVFNRKDEELGRESWVVYVDEATQEALEDYVLNMIEGIAPGQSQRIVDTYDVGRRFHVSLANLTGNPGDSVR